MPSANPRLRVRLFSTVQHDDDAEVFLNGVQVARLATWSNGAYIVTPILDSGLLRDGPNLLAVHCRNGQGPQFIDAGIFEEIEPYEED
jgi:hypothetical protein